MINFQFPEQSEDSNTDEDMNIPNPDALGLVRGEEPREVPDGDR